jgi:hypothetical protein
MKFILALLLTSSTAQAFVLISPYYKLANPKETSINIASDTCPNLGVSYDVIRVAIEQSIEKYWNTVTESRLRLKVGGIVDRHSLNEVESGEILISCVSQATGGFTENDDSRGAAMIYLNPLLNGTQYVLRTLTHELGHAVGLHHSDDRASVMTYNSHDWGPTAGYLSQDDKDGVVYLYPNEGKYSGLIPGCEVQASQRDKSAQQIIFGILQEILGAALIILLLKFAQKLYRS